MNRAGAGSAADGHLLLRVNTRSRGNGDHLMLAGQTGMDGAIAQSNAAEGIPRGNIQGGRHPDWMQHYTRSHMFPEACRYRDSPPGCSCGAEPRSKSNGLNVN
jgi:hypothetical protein